MTRTGRMTVKDWDMKHILCSWGAQMTLRIVGDGDKERSFPSTEAIHGAG